MWLKLVQIYILFIYKKPTSKYVLFLCVLSALELEQYNSFYILVIMAYQSPALIKDNKHRHNSKTMED